jgi:HK97 gp10 family phage protein
MPVEITIRFEPDLVEKVRKLGIGAIMAFNEGILESGYELQKEIKELIRRSPRGGRKYRVGKNRFHKSSAPGQPPARDTGALMNSIYVEKFGFLGAFSVEVGSAQKYAEFLEDGTSKMKARPFLRPAWENKKGAIEELIARKVEESIG